MTGMQKGRKKKTRGDKPAARKTREGRKNRKREAQGWTREKWRPQEKN